MKEEKEGLEATHVPVKVQGAPLRWHCQPLSVLTTEGDLKLLRNALQDTGAIFPRSKDGTETRGSDISAGHLLPL